jgi:hypothetical protein
MATPEQIKAAMPAMRRWLINRVPNRFFAEQGFGLVASAECVRLLRSLLAPKGEGGTGNPAGNERCQQFPVAAASPSSEPARAGDYPSYDDLVRALDAAGATLTAYERCPHQGVHIAWHRPARNGEQFWGLPVADPVECEVVEYHYAPLDELPASPKVMRETSGRAIQRAILGLRDDIPPSTSSEEARHG